MFTDKVNLIIQIDPLNVFDLPIAYINESLGLIPMFLANREKEETVKEALTLGYGFGELFEMKHGTIHKYIYKYEDDPDLYPLAKMTSGDTVVLQYKYGIVAILEKDGTTFVTRMD